jgi:phosphoglycolate phosphatase-like HAD superfamily hydrolase
VGDWRAALGRFAEDRAPVYFRPSAETTHALRALAAARARIGVFTDAPEPLARTALAHLGALRRIDVLEWGSQARERALARLGGDAAVVSTPDELARLAQSSAASVSARSEQA